QIHAADEDAVVGRGRRVLVTTKGALIERDVDLLGALAHRNLVQVGITVTTMDAKISRLMEPRVPAPARLIKTIETISQAGVPVRVLVSPLVPGLTDDGLENVLAAARGAGASRATYALLRLPREVSPLFQDWLRTHYPDRFTKVMARVRETHGGKDYDPKWGKRMRGEGVHADLIKKRFDLACDRLGFAADDVDLDCNAFAVPPRAGDQLSLF
ncbi:MAG: radical SAM protein, partial [Pseudomonadota bacterium]